MGDPIAAFDHAADRRGSSKRVSFEPERGTLLEQHVDFDARERRARLFRALKIVELAQETAVAWQLEDFADDAAIMLGTEHRGRVAAEIVEDAGCGALAEQTSLAPQFHRQG